MILIVVGIIKRKLNLKIMNKENLKTPRSIRTFTGQYVNLQKPQISTINIIDIAVGLSREQRFQNQLLYNYSVASHCINVSERLPDRLKLCGLLHDATEAYLKDIAKPIKELLPDYKELEEKLWRVISVKFHLPKFIPERVHEVDNQLLREEWNYLMLGSNREVALNLLSPEFSGNVAMYFLKEFEKLKAL